MPFFETRQARARREANQRREYPEFEIATPTEIGETDAFSRRNGGNVTGFTEDAENTFLTAGDVFESQIRQSEPIPRPREPDFRNFAEVEAELGTLDAGPSPEPPGRFENAFSAAFNASQIPRAAGLLGAGAQIVGDAFTSGEGVGPVSRISSVDKSPVADEFQTEITRSLERLQADPTGLPIRTVIRQGSQSVTDPIQALGEQFELEQQGGLGFGLEDSAPFEALRRIPGIEADIPGTDISTFDTIAGVADVAFDLGGLAAIGAAIPQAARGTRVYQQLTQNIPVGLSTRDISGDVNLLRGVLNLPATLDDAAVIAQAQRARPGIRATSLSQARGPEAVQIAQQQLEVIDSVLPRIAASGAVQEPTGGVQLFRAIDKNSGRYYMGRNAFTEDPNKAITFLTEAEARNFAENTPFATDIVRAGRAGADEAAPAVERTLPSIGDRPAAPTTVPGVPGRIPSSAGGLPGAPPRPPRGPTTTPSASGPNLPGSVRGRTPSDQVLDPLKNVPPLKPYEPPVFPDVGPAARGPSPDLPRGVVGGPPAPGRVNLGSAPGPVTPPRPPRQPFPDVASPARGPSPTRLRNLGGGTNLPGEGRAPRNVNLPEPNLEHWTKLEDAESTLRGIWRTINDIAGLPRTIKSSFDLSAPFNQGALDITRTAWWRSWGPMVKAMFNDDFALARQDELLGGPVTAARATSGDLDALAMMGRAEQRRLAGVDMTAFDDAATRLFQREEGFQTTLADRIPGIRASNRAFTTFMNEIRAAKFDNFLRGVNNDVLDGVMTPAERTDELRNMARWVNISGGRGDLPERVATSDLLVSANKAFFSPRRQISRFQALWELLRVVNPKSNLSRQMRLEIARDMSGFVGAGVGALAFMDAMGWIEVELDPRSTDFGKGRIPFTGERYDPWAGFQPTARFIWQTITAESKNSTTGEVRDIEGNFVESRADVGLRFIRGKLGPGIPTMIVDLATGSTFIGEPAELEDPEGLVPIVGEQFVPLSAEDIVNGARAEGLIGALKSLPAAVGIGFNQYQQPADVKDAVALEQFGVRYKELNRGEQRTVDEDQRVVDKVEEYIREDETEDLNRDQTSALFDQYNRNRERLEQDLAAKLTAGVTGEALREEITNFKNDMYVSGQAIFDGPLGDSFDDEQAQQVEDALAEQYWSAAAPESVTAAGDVRVDYDTQEALREEVLDRARALGVDLNYIVGTGPDTYRGQRYDDETVRAAILEFEQFRDTMRDTGFWDLRDEAWIGFRDLHFDALGDIPDYWDWRQNEVLEVTQQFINAGENPVSARDRAETEVAGYKTVSQFNEFYRTQFRHGWVVDNRQLALQAVEFGYLDPDKPEGQFLSDLPAPAEPPNDSFGSFGSSGFDLFRR